MQMEIIFFRYKRKENNENYFYFILYFVSYVAFIFLKLENHDAIMVRSHMFQWGVKSGRY